MENLPIPHFNTSEKATLALAQSVFDQLDAAESTRIDYKYRIQKFLNFLAIRPLDRNSYLEYKRMLAADANMAVATKNKYLAAARVFLKELNRLGHIPVDITQNVKAFKQDKKHKKDGITDDEMRQILAHFQTPGGKIDCTDPNMRPIIRLKLLIALLAFNGLRQIEISRLNVTDIDLAHKLAFIRGKGRDDKEPIFLHPETTEALRQYLQAYAYTEGPLFRSESNSSVGQRLSTRGIRGIVTEFLREWAAIDKTVHGFRHYFTTRLIKAYKGDLIEVSHYTRHRSLEMLQVYNDRLQVEADLPRFYDAFAGASFR